jgi:hypothetical protein
MWSTSDPRVLVRTVQSCRGVCGVVGVIGFVGGAHRRLAGVVRPAGRQPEVGEGHLDLAALAADLEECGFVSLAGVALQGKTGLSCQNAPCWSWKSP